MRPNYRTSIAILCDNRDTGEQWLGGFDLPQSRLAVVVVVVR